jgi:adenylate cyclase
MPETTRQLVAIMFTDIVGYTALMGDAEEKAFNLLERNRKLQKPLIERYGGKWIKELGDGVLATFSTVSDAVYCAAAIQQGSDHEPDLNLRIGIHQGEVVFKDGDVFGDGVNIASRLESLAPTGGIWVSETVKVNIQNKHGIETTFVKEEQLKNVKDPIKIYAIKVEDFELPEPSDNSPGILIKSKSSYRAVYLTLPLLVIVLLSYWVYNQYFSSTPAVAENVTIAVLAFDDQSPGGDQEWLGDGMADEILNVLAKVKGLQVTGKTSSFSFKGKDLTTKVIGKTLKVDNVLEGSVSKIGNKIRFTAQLIDVETDAQIWSKKYDRDAADIFAIVDEVAQSIASSLRSKLSVEDIENIKIDLEVDLEAYEYYLKGVYLLYNSYVASGGVDGFKHSEKMFLNAIAIDSMYANAYAGLADLYDAKAWSNSIYNRKRDSIANIAYNINPNSAYTLMTKGLRFRRVKSFNQDSVFFFYQRAYKIDPKNTRVSKAIVAFYHQIGLYEQCINLGTRLLKSDPFDNYSRAFVASSYLYSGKVDEAKMVYKKIFEIDKDFHFPTTMEDLLIIAIVYDNDKDEANRIINELQVINPNSPYSQYRAWMSAIEGKKEEALSLNTGFITYCLLNMKKEALQRLNSLSVKSIYVRSMSYNYLQNIKFTEFIRDEPQFKEIITKAKKVHDARVAKYGHLFDE